MLMDLFGLNISDRALLQGIVLGFCAWFVLRCVIFGFYTVDQNERAVKTSFGRAHRLKDATTLTLPIAETLRPDQRKRYVYPQVRVIGPGGPYFRWPWQRVHKVSIATRTVNMAWDPENSEANHNGTLLEAVTKDQLNTGLTGDLRYRVSEQNLYAEVSPKSSEWGYMLGSVYIRKVHFRDAGMIRQIEEKVVNRLRQVTSAIKQTGANQVSVITSAAEREAAVDFAKAGALRPQIVGATLQRISEDPEVAEALFEILEIQKLVEGDGRVTLVPEKSGLLAELLAAAAPHRVTPPAPGPA